ncbi:MAG: response regulator [Nitrospirae bacterium]|nr:response regulator [Nitrospirota bacterium]
MQKILIADDEEDIRLIIRLALEDKGYTVLAASNGLEALEKAGSEKVDLIILDAAMPKMDGYEACRRLKNNPSTKDIPVIFLTAIDVLKDKKKSYRLGAAAFITKPFEINLLIEEIEGALRNGKS